MYLYFLTPESLTTSSMLIGFSGIKFAKFMDSDACRSSKIFALIHRDASVFMLLSLSSVDEVWSVAQCLVCPRGRQPLLCATGSCHLFAQVLPRLLDTSL